MDKNKLNINQNKNHKNKERKTTPQYNFKKDFLNNINFDKNKNEKIRASFPIQQKEKELNSYIEKKKYVIPKNKKYIRNLSSKNPIENRLFYNVPLQKFNSNEYNNYNKMKQKINQNKSSPKFKKVNYIEIYRKNSNNQIIRNNIPLIHINLSNSIRRKNQNPKIQNLTPNQTLKKTSQKSNNFDQNKLKTIHLNNIKNKTSNINSNQNLNSHSNQNSNPYLNSNSNLNSNQNQTSTSNINSNQNQISNPNTNPNEKNENIKIESTSEIKKENSQNEKKLYIDYYYKEDPNITSREKMEDFHSIIPNLSLNPLISYFAIFDGHNGDKPALYCMNNFHKIILQNLKINNFDIEKSLINSYEKIDNEISKENYNEESGTTSTTLLIYEKLNEKYFACANVGDSQCYLIKKNSVIKISKDHKCNDKSEVDRIKKCGGMVFNGRVFGTLMLTRSIGDREMKNYGVCSIPYVNICKICDDDLYFVIASDGVWDVINEDDIFNICIQGNCCKDICEEIIRKSIDDGTKDNVSCIVVKV